MFKNGHITCCPVCKNDNSDLDTIIGLSKEFGVPFYECSICNHASVRDLTHGIENDSIPSNKKRNKLYVCTIDDMFDENTSILEVGPGDYRLVAGLIDCGFHNITTIDVGINFASGGRGTSLLKWSVPVPKSPREVFEVSEKMHDIILNSQKNCKFDLGISLHSWEHSPDPITMIKLIEKFCSDFVIEVPNGRATYADGYRQHAYGTILDVTVCPIEWKNKIFPLLPRGIKRGMGKGALVGGHYQIFNEDSLAWIAKNVLEKGRKYYIGVSIYNELGITLTTKRDLVRRLAGMPYRVIEVNT